MIAPIISGPYAWRSHIWSLYGCYWINEGIRLDFYSIVLHPDGIKGLAWSSVGLWMNLCISIFYFFFLNCSCPKSSIAPWYWGSSRSWLLTETPWKLTLSLVSDLPEVRSQYRHGVVTSTDRSHKSQRIKIEKKTNEKFRENQCNFIQRNICLSSWAPANGWEEKFRCIEEARDDSESLVKLVDTGREAFLI